MIGKEKERGDLFMNKNLKRALNTTAAVSMSLAMVLGAVAPSTATSVAAAPVATSTEKQRLADAYSVVGAVYDALYYNDIDVKGMKVDTTDLDNDASSDAKFKEEFEIALNGKEITVATTTSLKGLGELPLTTGMVDAWDKSTKLSDLFSYVATNSEDIEDADADVVALAEFMNGPKGEGIAAAVKAFETAVEKDDFKNNAVEDKDFGSGSSADATYRAAKAALDEVKKYRQYAGNAGKTAEEIETLDQAIGFLSDNIASYKDENEDVFVGNYVAILEDKKVYNDGPTVYDLVERDAEIELSNLSKLEKFIKSVKNDGEADLKKEAKYEDVKDNSEVAGYIEGLEAIVEEMKEAKELVKSNNAAVKAYKKQIGTKVVDLMTAVNKTYGNQDTKDAAIEAELLKFRNEDREALKTYVEEVVEQFYAVTPKQLSSGNYAIRLEDAGYGRYLAPANNNDLFKLTPSLFELLTQPVDKEVSEETYYDVLIDAVTDVEELLANVTTDIEGITLNTQLTSVEANKIIKAKKALDQLMDSDRKDFETEYKSALTSKEKKEVKSNVTLIDTLYLKLILNGEVTTIGWVEDAKGWQYYDNNGNRVMEGWAPGNGYWSYMKNGYAVMNDWCAAKEGWYYMGADGKMVTGKVMINGVEEDFGTDGIWVRK